MKAPEYWAKLVIRSILDERDTPEHFRFQTDLFRGQLEERLVNYFKRAQADAKRGNENGDH